MATKKTIVEPRLYSYILRIDDGAAPNPYGRFCTLTICKPKIRKNAKPRDWVIGTGSKNTRQADGSKKNFSKHLVYAMKVSKIKTLEEYEKYCRAKLKIKIPIWGSNVFEEMVGDCIYYNFSTKKLPEIKKGVHNKSNRRKDLRGINALLSNHFYYFGDKPVKIPKQFRSIIKKNQGHLKITDQQFIGKFVKWLRKNFQENKLYGDPQGMFEFLKPHKVDFSSICSKRYRKLYHKDGKEKVLNKCK